MSGYHDFYVAYDPATHQDKFYGAGPRDITSTMSPSRKTQVVTSIVGAAGVDFGHTFTPTPDGRYAIAETEYQWAPLRIFDLKPGLEGKIQTVTQPIGAWQPDWHDLVHNHEVRWPFVFASGYEDGLQIFSMYDPDASGDRRLVLHLPVRAREGVRRGPPMGGDEHFQRRFRDRRPEQGWADHDQRLQHWCLVLPDGRVQRLEWPRLGNAEHLQRPGLRPRPGGLAGDKWAADGVKPRGAPGD